MERNITMKLLAMMMVFSMFKLVALQTYESPSPSLHPHPLLISSHLLAPTPSSLLPFDTRRPRPWSPREGFKVARCIGGCALDCFRLHREVPAKYAHCFGDCVKDVCGDNVSDSVYDCALGCSESTSTHFESDSDKLNGYMETCSRVCTENF